MLPPGWRTGRRRAACGGQRGRSGAGVGGEAGRLENRHIGLRLRPLAQQDGSPGRISKRGLGQFPGGSVVKNPPASAGDTGLIPGREDSRVLQGQLRVPTTESVLLSPGAAATEGRTPQSPCSAPREAPAVRSLHIAASVPRSSQLEKSPHCDEDPACKRDRHLGKVPGDSG